MRLDLRFSERSLENIWCQAVTAFSFQPLDLDLSGLDNLNLKMGGPLTDLLASGRWTGEKGESFLLSSQGAIPAEKILFLGLGPASECNLEILQGRMLSMGSALDKLAVNDFAIYLPLIMGREKEYAAYLEHSVPWLVRPFYETHGSQGDYRLKIVCCVKRGSIYELGPIIASLREYFSTLMECSIVVGYETEMEEPADQDFSKNAGETCLN